MPNRSIIRDMQVSPIAPYLRYTFLAIPVSILIVIPQMTDPINLPKLLSLITLTLTSIILFVFLRKKYLIKKTKQIKFFSALYAILAILMIVSAIVGNSNWVRVLFGTSGRNNGLLFYLSLTLLSILIINSKIELQEVRYLNRVLTITSIIFGVYCLVQFIDLDPIDWDNIYNRIIGTLGNPNFSASALSGFAVMWLFGTRRVEKDSGLIRYLHWIVAISLGILAISTESLQALVLLALGMVLFAFSKMREKNAGSFIPYLLIGSGGLLGLFMFLSFSGLGPLSSVFEQQTLKLRFWYAYFALRGIIENPLIGQGVDNYAYVYRRFRTKEFVEQYGSTLYSDNAHSTPFQVGSSFGALVLIIYLLLNFIALIKALAILNSPNVNFHSQKRIAALWILVFFQSLLSIEIIGLAVLNWLLSAFLLALPKNEFELVRKAARQRTTENPSSEMPPWVGALTLISFLLSSVPSFIVYKENQIVRVLSQSFTNNKENINFIRDEFHKLTGLTTQTPINVFQILNNLYLAQMTNEVESMLVELVAVEKRNIFAKDMLATHYQNMKDYMAEVQIREEMRELDPWSFQYESFLAAAYFNSGDLEGFRQSLRRVQILAPDSEEYKKLLMLIQENESKT